jgi:ABC-2 type transport system ATP-binding protein
MESVEEICDHIALIDKSKTILEGGIKNIKEQFANNNYEIITKDNKLESNNLYEVISTQDYKSKIILKNEVSGNEALNYINDNYSIVSFKKENPTMEEIFIKAVNNA